MRLRKCGQVADRPRHDVSVALKVSVALLVCTEHAGDISRHGRLFGQHGNGTRIRRAHLSNFQFTDQMRNSSLPE
jgi:hypothetical protein